MRCLLTAAVLVALNCAPAFAEDEVVVTATRASTPRQRLPARIEIIDRADIEAQNIVTLPEALGAQAVQAGGAGQQTSLFLRGANSKHALALLDGVRLNDSSNPTGQYDFGQDTLGGLERIEILRGPASAIYGSDAIGGVVNMIPRRGGELPFSAFAEISLSSFDTHRAALGAAGASEGIAYGVSTETIKTDGYDLIPARMSTHTGDRDGASIATITASVRYDAGGFAIDALLRARESESQFDTFSGGAFFDLRADDPDLENTNAQQLWRLAGEWDAGVKLRLAGGQVLSQRAETDSGIENASADLHRDFAELTALYEHGAAQLTAGLAFERDAIETASPFADRLLMAQEQTAAFVVGQVDITQQIVGTASLRVDDYDSFGAHTTYSLGAVADLAPLRLFASLGTAFKAPSLSERYEVSFFNHGNPDLLPEASRSWEIGADWAANESIGLGASYYQTRIEELIEYDFAQSRNINIGRAEIEGAELFAEAKLASWASLRAAYAWADARNAAGGQLARRPRHSWRLDARVNPTARLSFVLSWSFVGDRADVTYDDGGNFEFPSGRAASFNLGALAATFALTSDTQLFARVDNLTDAVYEQPAAFAGAPRSLSLGLRANF
jgi:vitamin B12 transporter